MGLDLNPTSSYFNVIDSSSICGEMQETGTI